MTMLTLVKPTNSAKSANYLQVQVRSFFKYTRSPGGRSGLSSLLTYIWETATLQSHPQILGRGGKRAIVPIALPGSAAFHICSTGLPALSLTFAFLI